MALGKSRCVRFEQFGVCESGGNPKKQKGLLASESENCVTGNSLKRGVGVRLKYRADGSSYGIDNTTPKADYYFSLCVNSEEKIGFVTKTGLLFLDDGKKPLSRFGFSAQTGGAIVYDENHAEKWRLQMRTAFGYMIWTAVRCKRTQATQAKRFAILKTVCFACKNP